MTIKKTISILTASALGLTALSGCAAAQRAPACALPPLLDYNSVAEGSTPQRSRGEEGVEAWVMDLFDKGGPRPFDVDVYAYQGGGRSELAECGEGKRLKNAGAVAYAVGAQTEVHANTFFELGGGRVELQIEPGRIGVVPIHAEVCDLNEISRCPVTYAPPSAAGGGAVAEINYVIEVNGAGFLEIPIRLMMRPDGRVIPDIDPAENILTNFREVPAPGIGVMFEWDATRIAVPGNYEVVRVTMDAEASTKAFCGDNVCVAAIAEIDDPGDGAGGVTLGVPD